MKGIATRSGGVMHKESFTNVVGTCIHGITDLCTRYDHRPLFLFPGGDSSPQKNFIFYNFSDFLF